MDASARRASAPEGSPEADAALHRVALALDVAARLRATCTGTPPAALAAVMGAIVAFHLRWDTPAARRCRPGASDAERPEPAGPGAPDLAGERPKSLTRSPMAACHGRDTSPHPVFRSMSMDDGDPHGTAFPRQHGVFYPTGHVVVAFGHPEDAGSVREALRAAGYADADLHVVSGAEVARVAAIGLEGAGLLPRLFGGEVEFVEQHLELARRGHTFLIVRSASDVETERLMAVVRRHPYAVAHKYDRLTVTEL